MYYLYGLKQNYNNVKSLLGLPLEHNNAELFNYYNQYLSSTSAFEQPVNWSSIKLVDFKGLQSIAPGYCKKHAHFFGDNSPDICKRLADNYFENALQLLKEKQPEFYQIVNLIIKMVVINKLVQYTEGTSYDTLGLSHMDFRMRYNEQDFYELLFHQLVHMLTFIDDQVNDQIIPKYKTIQAAADFEHKAGGNSFPLFIGFHSYIVGVEILLYRYNTNTWNFMGNYHGSTASIVNKCIRGSKFIQQHIDKFTPKGKEILANAYDQVIRFNNLL